MVSVTVVVCLTPPPLPVTVIGYVPSAAMRSTVTVMVELPAPGAGIMLGLKLTATPKGTPEAEILMELLKPPLIVVVMVETPTPFWPILRDEGVAEIVKLPVAANGKVNNKTLNSKQRSKTAHLFRIIAPTSASRRVRAGVARQVGKAII